jgi:hypothetical protein
MTPLAWPARINIWRPDPFGVILLTQPRLSDQREQIMKAADLNYIRPFFLGDKAGPQRNRYVLWLDVMGAGPKIARNVRTASIPVMKLHVAALTAVRKNTGKTLDLFPIIDGLYVASEDLNPLMFFMSEVLRSMAAEFLMLGNWERSMVRGAVSYGPVIFGRESIEGSEIFKDTAYLGSILLGMPLAQAYTSERLAPPFGVYVHESARAFAPVDGQPMTTVFWRWWRTNKIAQQVVLALPKEIESYFEWCRNHTAQIEYPLDRINAHHRLATEYLSDLESTFKADEKE